MEFIILEWILLYNAIKLGLYLKCAFTFFNMIFINLGKIVEQTDYLKYWGFLNS